MLSDLTSDAARLRMIRLSLYLESLEEDWEQTKLTSEELAAVLDATPATVRKDLSGLGCPADGRGYRVRQLRENLKTALGLKRPVRGGVAGLDPWGALLLNRPELFPGIEIRAGFDRSMNRLERTGSPVPLYPSYEIPEVFRTEGLSLGIIASAGEEAQKTARRMIEGGAAGILNLSPRPVRVPRGIFLHQADIQSGLLRLLSQINRGGKGPP